MKDNFSPNGIWIPDNWAYAYQLVRLHNQKVWQAPYSESRYKDLIYVMERYNKPNQFSFNWHYNACDRPYDPSDFWEPLAVFQSDSWARKFLDGFHNTIDAIEIVQYQGEKQMSLDEVRKLIGYLVEMERI